TGRTMPARADLGRAEQRARGPARRRSGDRGEAEILCNASDDLAISVLADHHHDALIAMMIQQWKELTMPQHENDRLPGCAKPPNVVIVRDANAPRQAKQAPDDRPEPDDPCDPSRPSGIIPHHPSP